MARLPPLLRQRLREQLGPAESLVWAGQPSATTLFKAGFVAWLLSIPVILLCTYALLSSLSRPTNVFDVVTNGSTMLFCMVVLPMACYGLYFPWRFRRDARYTVYAITSERAFVLDGIGSASIRSFAREEGADFKCVERKDGSGDLILEYERTEDSDGCPRITEHGFFAIAEVAKVAALATALQQRLRARRIS